MKQEAIKQSIKFKCFFCFSEHFILPFKGYVPFHGCFLVCANCGKENDYTSQIDVVERQALEIAEVYAKQVINDFTTSFKKTFKNSKYIKIK